MEPQIFSREKLQWRLEYFQRELEAVQKSRVAVQHCWATYVAEEIERMKAALKTDKQAFEVYNGYVKI